MSKENVKSDHREILCDNQTRRGKWNEIFANTIHVCNISAFSTFTPCLRVCCYEMSLYLLLAKRRFVCFLTEFRSVVNNIYLYHVCLYFPFASWTSPCYDLLLEIDLQRETESEFLSKADGLFIVCHAGLAGLLKMLLTEQVHKRYRWSEGWVELGEWKSFSWNVVFVFTISFHDIFTHA